VAVGLYELRSSFVDPFPQGDIEAADLLEGEGVLDGHGDGGSEDIEDV